MKTKYLYFAYFLFSIFFFSSITKKVTAQYLPIFHYDSKENSWYNDSKYAHSSLQPFYNTDTLTENIEKRKSWFGRKLFDEELVRIKTKEARLFINFLPDIYIGNDGGNTIWNNTRGIQIKGDVKRKFSFDFQMYENQAMFPKYIDTISIPKNSVVGQGWFEPKNKIGLLYDYTYATAHIAYKAEYFSFKLANDKLFIGDGYRSLLLSDVSIPYPYFQASFENKKLQYSAIYMQHIDPLAPQLSKELGFQKKWAVMHYLNWNITKKISLGLFDAVIWQDADTIGKRGFEMSYANPIIFLRAAEFNTNSTDNALLGVNFKYQWNENNKIYFQFMLDELKIDEYVANKGWWANKFAVQLGVRSKNIFKIENLNGFTEINLVKPYTYTHRNTQRSYTNYADALAHPLGANFIENVSRLEYRINRWSAMMQVNYSEYGLDSLTGTNVGKNIYVTYDTRDKEYGNKILQGIPGSLLFVDLRLAYVLNPKTNMRVELGYVYRDEKIAGVSNVSNIITFGLRSSFRNLYFDR